MKAKENKDFVSKTFFFLQYFPDIAFDSLKTYINEKNNYSQSNNINSQLLF
jgi:hypothetical protein